MCFSLSPRRGYYLRQIAQLEVGPEKDQASNQSLRAYKACSSLSQEFVCIFSTKLTLCLLQSISFFLIYE
jgi:hypothetical protein